MTSWSQVVAKLQIPNPLSKLLLYKKSELESGSLYGPSFAVSAAASSPRQPATPNKIGLIILILVVLKHVLRVYWLSF